MKNDYAQVLLQDKEVEEVLKDLILLKANLYDDLSEKLLTEAEYNACLSGEITPDTIYKVIAHYDAKDELNKIKRDLSSMCYELNKSRNKISEDTKWEKAYDYATNIVRIDAVVSNLLGLSNFGRNISCPFHEDKNPSLKVYTKNNRFVCFSCGARGSPIDFVMKYKNCSFKEAVLYLSNL